MLKKKLLNIVHLRYAPGYEVICRTIYSAPCLPVSAGNNSGDNKPYRKMPLRMSA